MQTSNIWKWASGKETEIEEMDLRSCLKAALHCMKRMRYYSDQTRFYEYKLDIARTKSDKEKAEFHIKRCSDVNLLFADKLEQISKRANQLGTPIPSNFEDVKSLLSDKFPQKDKKKEASTDPVKQKAEEQNVKEEEQVNEYF